MNTEIKVKKVGFKSPNAAAFEKIGKMKKGASAIVYRKDWKIKTKPGMNIIRRNTGREFKVETLIDESGWRITALN